MPSLPAGTTLVLQVHAQARPGPRAPGRAKTDDPTPPPPPPARPPCEGEGRLGLALGQSAWCFQVAMGREVTQTA